MTLYLLYEAADALLRLKNCGHPTIRILMPMFRAFYENENQSAQLEQLFADQPVDQARLMLTVPDTLFRNTGLALVRRLTEYCESGLALVLDNYEPGHISEEMIREIGFAYIRPIPEQEACKAAASLEAHGITVIGRSSTNLLFTEDEMIRDILMNEQA
jgi:EAL domain-containing protein (putative c-di-GMP-specific phosphodiesterase class I)